MSFNVLGVGGIEAEAVMLGQAINMVLPEVVGFKLTGQLNELATSTDLVLTITAVSKKGTMSPFVIPHSISGLFDGSHMIWCDSRFCESWES